MKTKVRSVFISDVHMGCGYSKSEELVNFLKHYDMEYLYLNGDIIDGWRFQKGWKWYAANSAFIRLVLKLAERGVKVKYTRGNHDEFLTPFLPLTVAGIEVREYFIHSYLDKKMLVIHGDIFDGKMLAHRWLYKLGDIGYTLMLHINGKYSRACYKLGLRSYPLSYWCKTYAKKTCNYFNDFNDAAREYAKEKGCDTVMCGHTHISSIIDGYHNSGDWVECGTAIVETTEGQFNLIRYNEWLETSCSNGSLQS